MREVFKVNEHISTMIHIKRALDSKTIFLALFALDAVDKLEIVTLCCDRAADLPDYYVVYMRNEILVSCSRNI